MKLLFCSFCLAILVTGSAVSDAASREHRRLLVEPAPQHHIATSRFAAQHGYVPTNTVAFREYALDLLIDIANSINRKWELRFPGPVTSDHVTAFSAIPKTNGIMAQITIANRYILDLDQGRLTRFIDSQYWRESAWREPLPDGPPVLQRSGEVYVDPGPGLPDYGQAAPGFWDRRDKMFLEWASIPDLLTQERARKIAIELLDQFELDTTWMKLLHSAETVQLVYGPPGEKPVKLPYYDVSWPVPSRNNRVRSPRIELSGITKTIVYYYGFVFAAPPVPDNYYEMLGITPDMTTWGEEFGYNPLNTVEFQKFAAEYALKQANTIRELWKVDFQEPFAPEHIRWFQAEPRTNGLYYSIQLTERFYFQGLQDGVEWFQDYSDGDSAFSRQELRGMVGRQTDMTKESALKTAREALRQIGLDDRQLEWPQPPEVIRVRLEGDQDKGADLPYFDVKWRNPKGGSDMVGFQLSGVTGRIVLYVNGTANVPLDGAHMGPKIPLPDDFRRIIGLPSAEKSVGN